MGKGLFSGACGEAAKETSCHHTCCNSWKEKKGKEALDFGRSTRRTFWLGNQCRFIIVVPQADYSPTPHPLSFSPELKGPSWLFFFLCRTTFITHDDRPWLTGEEEEEEKKRSLKNRERRVWQMDRSCHSLPFLLSVVRSKSLTAKPRKKKKKKISHCFWGNKKNHFVSITIVAFYFFFSCAFSVTVL